MRELRKTRLFEYINQPKYMPLLFEELAVVLEVPLDQRNELKEILDEFVSDAVLMQTKKGRYESLKKMGLLAGMLQGSGKGFAFLLTEDDSEDIFIPENKKNGAIHGDKVLVKLTSRAEQGFKREGYVEKIISNSTTSFTGNFSINKKGGVVYPDNAKIGNKVFIQEDDAMNAQNNDKVMCIITKRSQNSSDLYGKILVVLGKAGDPETELKAIMNVYGIESEYPEDAIKDAQDIYQKGISKEEKEKRLDLRDVHMVTIDGEDAKDLDDAISIESIEHGLVRLGVHIADVTHYVTENSKLDLEARKRGTSVYFPDRVIPMLPKELSNGLCSLTSGEDRLAFSVIMDIDKSGVIKNYKIEKTIINIDKRMTYNGVYDMIINPEKYNDEEIKPFVKAIDLMYDLAKILRQKRMDRGALDMEFPEAKIVLNEKGTPIGVKLYEINDAHKIIEEFMLLCNETVSQHFYWLNIPFVYRIHEDPDLEKIEHLKEFAAKMGYNIHGSGNVHSRELQSLIDSVKNTEHERIVSRMLLRSLQKAIYSHEHTGHFGLAAEYYSHFTSPIRRYPDLIIHRIMTEYLNNKFNDKLKNYYESILPEIAKNCSVRERAAESAEYEFEKMKKAEYMQNYIGEEFEGVISGVINSGLFIELPNTIEGFVRVNTIKDDYYNFDQASMSMIGERSAKTYAIGDSVVIIVAAANPTTKQIDFELKSKPKVAKKSAKIVVKNVTKKSYKKEGSNNKSEYKKTKNKKKKKKYQKKKKST